MRKFLLFAYLFLAPLASNALTRISVQNGNWNSPNTWSPVGVPQPSDDSIVVATVVDFNGYNVNVGVPYFEVAVTGTLYGGVNDTLTFGGDVFLMNGGTFASVAIVGASDSAVVNFELIAGNLFQSGTMINNRWICISQQLTTSDDFINNESVACNDWINSGNVTGTQGQFCIAQNFINTDQISGSLDICDASPGGFGDINMGTIAGSVTNCAVGPCSSCPIPGFQEYVSTAVIRIAPHPVSSVALIQIEAENAGSNSQNTFTLTDVQGRVVAVVPFYGSSFIFDRRTIENGLYLYTLIQEGQVLTTGKLIIN